MYKLMEIFFMGDEIIILWANGNKTVQRVRNPRSKGCVVNALRALADQIEKDQTIIDFSKG